MARVTLTFDDVFVEDVPGIDDGLDVIFYFDFEVGGFVGVLPELLKNFRVEVGKVGVIF